MSYVFPQTKLKARRLKFKDDKIDGQDAMAGRDEVSINALLAACDAGLIDRAKQTGRRARRRQMKSSLTNSSVVAALLAAQACQTLPGGDPIEVGGPGEPEPGPEPAPEPAPEPEPDPVPPPSFTTESSEEKLIPFGELVSDGETVSAITGVENGEAMIEGSFVKFTASEGFTGLATFSYEVSDENGVVGERTAEITVEADAPPGEPEPGDGGPADVPGDPEPGDPAPDDPAPDDPVPDDPVEEPGDDPHDPPAGSPHTGDPTKMPEHMSALALVPIAEATHVAVASGSWFEVSTWASGTVPGDGAKVVVPEGVTVDYDGVSDASIFTVRVDGVLEFATDTDTFLELDTMVVSPGGALIIGTADNPVAADVDAVISIADNGPIDVAWDPLLLSRGIVSQGKTEIYGAEKENFIKVATDPMAGDTSMVLDGAPEGWQVGDRLVLTGTHLTESAGPDGKRWGKGEARDDATEDEELIITAIDGNTIYFDQPLAFDHDTPRADLKAYAANYSRNIRIETENADGVPVHQRGHVMFMHSDDVDVRYAEFFELGRTDKSERAFDVAEVENVESDTNIKTRYPLHIHRAGVSDQDNPAILEGNAIWGSPGWGVVHHDSNALISGNAAYDVFGAAFVAETGNETGRWSDNIAIKAQGIARTPSFWEDVQAFDLGRSGTGFWFQGRMVEAVDNVAAGMPGGIGFVYMSRGLPGDIIRVDPDTVLQSGKLRYVDDAGITEPNIGAFRGNESIAVSKGLEILKNLPDQGHDFRSVLQDFTAWEVETGAFIQYTGRYTLIDFDLTMTETDARLIKGGVGIQTGNNTFDVVINGAEISGFEIGVNAQKGLVGRFKEIDGDDVWNYIYIDVNVSGAVTDFAGVTASDRFLTAEDLTIGRLDYQSAFGAAIPMGPDGPGLRTLEIAGVKTDSIGSTETSTSWDTFNITRGTLIGAVEQNGYWTTPDGRNVTVIEEYITDRATGFPAKFGVFVEIPPTLNILDATTTRPAADYNGLLEADNQAPIAVDETATVKAGGAVTVDVLANDWDPDGNPVSLSDVFSPNGFAVAGFDEGAVTFFADPDAQVGDELAFYYWIEDDNGAYSMAMTTVIIEA